MERLKEIMAAVCKHPGMYFGCNDMRMVRAYLDGFAHALGTKGYPFGGFLRWLEVQHNICHPAWGWDRILVHAAGSHFAAIHSLPECFDAYCQELATGAFNPNTARGNHASFIDGEPDSPQTEKWHEHGDPPTPPFR